jgi:hypothetical protein
MCAQKLCKVNNFTIGPNPVTLLGNLPTDHLISGLGRQQEKMDRLDCVSRIWSE